MPAPVTIGGSGTLFIGTDKLIAITIKDAAGALVNVTGFTFKFVVKISVNVTTAILDIPGVITGTFAGGTQRVEMDLTDTQTSLFSARTYKYSLKRMDDGSEDIYAHGDLIAEKATQV